MIVKTTIEDETFGELDMEGEYVKVSRRLERERDEARQLARDLVELVSAIRLNYDFDFDLGDLPGWVSEPNAEVCHTRREPTTD